MNFKKNKTIFYIPAPGFLHNMVIGIEIILKKLIAGGYNVVIILLDKEHRIPLSGLNDDCEIYTFKESTLITLPLSVIRFVLAKKNLPNLPTHMTNGWNEMNFYNSLIKKIFQMLSFTFLGCLSESKLLFLFNKIVLFTKVQKLFKLRSPFLSIFYAYVSSLDEAIVVSAAKNVQSKTVSIPDRFAAFTEVFYYTKTNLILVWNEMMREQAIKWHRCENSTIKPIGILRVDAFKISNKKLQSRDEFIQSNGLVKGRKIISLIGGNISLSEASRIGKLISSSKEIQVKIQILYRSQPGSFEKDLKCLKSLKDENLFLIKGFSSKFKESEIQNQLLNTANFLKNSDVIISLASTMGVEALYFNIPCIFLMYGNTEDLFWYKQDHIAMLLQKEGIKIVQNDLELIKSVKYYLINPALDIHTQVNLFGKYCHLVNDDSIQRCYKEINNFFQREIITFL